MRTAGESPSAGDKGYYTHGFVDTLRALDATPHIARKKTSPLDGRKRRHPEYVMIQRARNRIEEVFRLDENSRLAVQAPPPRRRSGELAISARRGGLKLGADADLEATA